MSIGRERKTAKSFSFVTFPKLPFPISVINSKSSRVTFLFGVELNTSSPSPTPSRLQGGAQRAT